MLVDIIKTFNVCGFMSWRPEVLTKTTHFYYFGRHVTVLSWLEQFLMGNQVRYCFKVVMSLLHGYLMEHSLLF